MAIKFADEMKIEVVQVVEEAGGTNLDCAIQLDAQTQQHPYAFHVSGPRNVPTINWRDLINSTWKDGKYKRTVIACFIQAVYLLEIDRQENRSDDTALAPKWWIPFKYKLVETLIDERDGSIFGAILEWDRAAALADFVLLRPSGAPRAVLVLRGTLLKSPTIRRDIEDDLRFLAWESLKGSVRFTCAFKALRSISDKYGSSNVCIAGHSLGAGFALQVGKALAKEGVFVEAHLFNPPSVSLASSLRNMGEKAGMMWKRVRAMLPSSSEGADGVEEAKSSVTLGSKQWVPHLYVNNSDYICCYYSDPVGVEDSSGAEKENAKPPETNNSPCSAKLFVFSKGKQKFMEAHGLEQWWSDDLELQMAVSNSKLISRQLKSLYSVPPTKQQSPAKTPTRAYGGVRKPLEAVRVFKKMNEYGCEPTARSYITVLSILVDENYLEMAFSFYRYMKTKGIRVSNTSLNVLIKALCKSNGTDAALKIFREMPKHGLTPDSYIYNTLINGLCGAGRLLEAKELDGLCNNGRSLDAMKLLERMTRKRLSYITYSSLLYGFFKESKPNEAVQILDRMKCQGLKPDAAMVYLKVVNGLCEIGKFHEAVILFDEMVLSGITPNHETWCLRDQVNNRIAQGLCSLGDHNQAFRLYMSFNGRGINFEARTFECLIECYCKKGDLHKAARILDEMVVYGCVVREGTWNDLLVGLWDRKKERKASELLMDKLIAERWPKLSDFKRVCTLQRGAARW